MSLTNKAIVGGLAGVALLVSAGAALAVPGEASASVNVRTCGSVRCGVVDQLYPGESVDIAQCQGGWCYVRHNGPDGWVSANYLDSGYSEPPPPPRYVRPLPPPPPPVYYPPRPRPYYYYHRPYYRHYDPGFCTGSPGFSFCVNP